MKGYAPNEIKVETIEGRTFRVGLRGDVPQPNTEAEAAEVIETLLELGRRIAGLNGETLKRVSAPVIEASVEWIPEEGTEIAPGLCECGRELGHV